MKKEIAIAFYKGPPKNDLLHLLSHYATRVWTASKWSHAELLVDGVCYSSSLRDKGVRAKVIDIDSGRWDVVSFEIDKADVDSALQWFEDNKHAKYDWRNIVRFVLPFVGQDWDKFVCYEAIGEALGFAGAYRITANDLYRWANKQKQRNTNYDA